MKPIYHFLLTIVPSLLVYQYFGLFYSSIVLIMGVIPDIDHVLDYWYHLGIKPLEITDEYYFETGKIYVLLHSFELIFVLFLVAYVINNNILFFAVFGLFLHVLFDSINFSIKNNEDGKDKYLFYFFTYRYFKNFQHEVLCAHKYD